MEDGNNIIYVSAVTIWEIEIKKALSKIVAPIINDKLISDSQFLELPIIVKHIEYLSQLKDYHTDPFDRLLICQCLVEHIVLLTEDKLIKQYQIKTA
ncbi:type II toxin-antitoxin system VapC family toxin [Candidatus Cyrtobacter comes]|uniref:type II toxin-antitoxin system VapC family toxin n=1 Tax=Candidatus Cyrtobacter comes TaxID=675776 RepID=UPI0039776D8B